MHGQDDVTHIRQDSMKSLLAWLYHGLEGRFSCVTEEHFSMFVVRNGLKNMIHQLLDTGEHTVGCRCLMYMDVVRFTITEYVC